VPLTKLIFVAAGSAPMPIATIGSINFDNRSLTLNDESTLMIASFVHPLKSLAEPA
jgi:phosphatidylserine/phosphatidylglycerophosphate/cardiolipin synthase-like enzyme